MNKTYSDKAYFKKSYDLLWHRNSVKENTQNVTNFMGAHTSKSLCMEKRVELLIFGYLRLYIEESDDENLLNLSHIAKDIKYLCYQYFQGLYENLKFGMYFNSKYTIRTNRNGYHKHKLKWYRDEQTGTQQFFQIGLFLSLNGGWISGSGVHEWKIKCIETNGKRWIGICCIDDTKYDINKLDISMLNIKLRNIAQLYTIHGWYCFDASHISGYRGKTTLFHQNLKKLKYDTNDNVIVSLDCIEWKVRFILEKYDSKTEKYVTIIPIDKAIPLQPNMKYYPFVYSNQCDTFQVCLR